MTKEEEAKIRRMGFPLDDREAKALLDFIEVNNPSHDEIEAEIVVKLEMIAKNRGSDKEAIVSAKKVST